MDPATYDSRSPVPQKHLQQEDEVVESSTNEVEPPTVTSQADLYDLGDDAGLPSTSGGPKRFISVNARTSKYGNRPNGQPIAGVGEIPETDEAAASILERWDRYRIAEDKRRKSHAGPGKSEPGTLSSKSEDGSGLSAEQGLGVERFSHQYVPHD